MRISAVFSLSLVMSMTAFAQVMEVPSTKPVTLPMYRPILIGKGPDALINRIDTQALMEKGQKDAIALFICSVRKTGEVEWSEIFGGTPESEPLKQELRKKLSVAASPRFIPGVFNHHYVDGIFYGTVTFAVVNGKPRLRIFANVEPTEVTSENDFIGPQPFFGPPSKFTGFHYPQGAPVTMDGSVEVKVKVDETGNLVSGVIDSVEPPGIGFGEACVIDITNAKFIPAFRDGKPVACEVTLPVIYTGRPF